MCGICGIVRPAEKAPIPSSSISSMNRTLFHRGPDDEGIYIGEGAALGTRRLSIIDLEGGHQPLSNEEGTIWISHNGEVYNFPSLREELMSLGHTFRTRTDTETIVHAYEEWGDAFVHKLRGMFAFAIWDAPKKRLLIVRDRLGIKPLYYTLMDDKTLVFGSELKAILAYPEFRASLEPRALDYFLTLEYIPAPFSIYKNVFKLPAGSFLTYEEGKTNINQYWELEPDEPRIKDLSEQKLDALMDELYSLLRESVQIRLISDVPLGAFLSGGIDSSAIVGLMREAGASPLKTFSIGFEDVTYDELDHARRVAQKFHTEHEEFILRPQILDLAEKLILHLDEPFGDFSVFPTYLVSKMARSRVKVILSGDGGDELFAGYEHYQAQKLSRLPFLATLNKSLLPAVKALPPSRKKKGGLNKLRRFAQGFEHPSNTKHLRWMMFLTSTEKKALYSPDFIRGLETEEPINLRTPFDRIFSAMSRFDRLNQELYIDLKAYLADDILVKVDRMSMAVSLETRVPLLDHKVVEFAFRIPGSLKLKGFTTKWILKKTMERLLPHKNITRSKEGFSIPIKHWLKEELKDLMLDHLNEKRIREGGIFDFKPIARMIDQHLKDKENFSHQLWALLVFEIWKDRYL
jgi:asparagine synthase (glutamine-hydrolysing)